MDIDSNLKVENVTSNLTMDIDSNFKTENVVSNNLLLNDMRCNGILCDATISVEDGSFNVHGIIMSACSPYFRAQFTTFSEAAPLPPSDAFNPIHTKNAHIPEVRASIMEQIIQYVYLGICSINDENVHELFTTADYLGILGLITQCKDYLAQMISAESCIQIMEFARFRSLPDLYAKARHFLMCHFLEVAPKNEDILKMNFYDFYDIIIDEELNVWNEDDVWKLCIKWINYDDAKRQQYVAKLMGGVRLGLLTPKCFMEEVKDHPYVLQSQEAKPIIVEALKILYDLDIINPAVGMVITPTMAMPRLPHEVIFAIGGWSGGSAKSCIETYDTRADRWISIPADDSAGPRAYHGTAAIDCKIYTIGGYDGMEYFNSCRIFDAIQMKWLEMAPMHCRRCYVSVAKLDGLIYALGGYDGHNRLNSAERYNPKTNQWSVIAPMNIQRSDASACALKGKIYVTGGFNGHACLDSAEVYDPSTNLWTLLPNMNHRRSGVACISFREHLYVFGGFNGLARLCSGERFNPQTETWSFIREMIHCRSNFALEIIDDMIFAIGGFNGVSTISHTECYVVETNQWLEATDMNSVRSALTANNVQGLPNIRDFVYKARDRLLAERRQRLLLNSMARNEQFPVSNMTMDTAPEAGAEEFIEPDAVERNQENVDEEGQALVRRLRRRQAYVAVHNRHLRSQQTSSQHDLRRRN